MYAALRKLPSINNAQLILPWAALVGIATVLTTSAPDDSHYELFLTGAPFIAAALHSVRRTAAFGVATITAYTVVHSVNSGEFGTMWWIQLALVIAACAIAVLISVMRQRERAMDHTREMASTLQHELLPLGITSTPNVEIRTRYKPADTRAGVGGDWYDTIPLSSARVGIAMGDVVGHGLKAAALMGKLRASVHTLADMDLSPNEILGHLDRLAARRSDFTDEPGLSFTCFYLIYDPVTRRVTMASAGHPPPALLRPDGCVEFPQVPAHPPLGIGGTTFENSTIAIPEDTVVALYTDGLLDLRHCIVEEAFGQIGAALTKDTGSLQQLCDHVTETVTGDESDDTAVLLARMTGKDPNDVATWDLPATPEAVGEARESIARQLADWNLEGKIFNTEVIISELVTNALVHAAGPISMRLIRDSFLTCEISDSSRTSPRQQCADAFDEAGRGLPLVNQLATHWGTRYTETGKVVWAEQPMSSI